MLAKGTAMTLAMALLGLAATPVFADDDRRPRHSMRSFFQAANMFEFGNPTNLLPGAATLTRTEDGISFRVYTSGLAPGAYTVWVVIFHRPENCTAGGPGVCMGPDLANPDVKGSSVYGTGAIAGMDGVANFHGSLNQGKPPEGLEIQAGTVDGLKNSREAEIHLVVRFHGPVMPGTAVNQLTTFEASAGAMNLQAVVFEAVK